MEVEDLTSEQIANLTPEQVTLLESNPEKLSEVLAEQAAKDTKDQPKPAVKDGVANDAGEEDGDEPVVLNKSGRVIPYVEHKELRVDNARLREQLAELTARQEATEKLQALKQEQDDATTPEEIEQAEKAIVAHLETFKEDMPELHEVVNHVHTANKRLTAQIANIQKELADSKEQVQRRKDEAIQEEATEARENNPQLMHWQNHDEAAWNEAVSQDRTLRQNPEWERKPIAERFDEVVRRVRAINPDASLPQTMTAAEQTRAAAKAKLEKAPARKPTTLSDIQGGANPASESEQLSNLSTLDLTNKLRQMSPQKAAQLRADLD